MNTNLHAKTMLFVLLALFLFPEIPAHAQLQFLIQPAARSGSPGDLLTYSATLNNTGPAEVFLNGTNFNLSGNGLVLDDSPFFDNFPLSLQRGEIFSGNLFTVQIGPSVSPGLYNGSFTLRGGPTDASTSTLATQNFSVTVGGATAPEPGSLGLVLPVLGLIGAVGLVVQKRPKK